MAIEGVNQDTSKTGDGRILASRRTLDIFVAHESLHFSIVRCGLPVPAKL
jgi:hypothetical protein